MAEQKEQKEQPEQKELKLGIQEFKPDWVAECCVCDQSPVVDVYEDGKLVYSTDMCGPCSFGEAAAIDPEEW